MSFPLPPTAASRLAPRPPVLGRERWSVRQTLLKDTSLVAIIGFEELFRRGQLIVAQNYRSFEIFASVALVYLVLTLLSSQAFSWLERWMNPVERTRTKTVSSLDPISVGGDHLS